MILATLNNIKEYNIKNKLSINLLSKEILGDTEWETLYKNNADIIDSIAYRLYGLNVLEDVNNPLITNNTSELISEIEFNTNLFVQGYKASINRLWALETVNFSPIENYDRYEDIKTVKSGDEITTAIKTGDEKETTTTNGSVINSIKNNQSEITKNEPTSYNTNLIDTSTTSYNGEADTQTTAYNGLTNAKDTAYNSVKDDTTHTYNDITDQHNAHIHGNIGVTTATAMMKEYVDFYRTYNFWIKFWELYVKINCRADYESEV